MIIQVADSVAIRDASLAIVKAVLTLIPPTPFSFVISGAVVIVSGLLIGKAIHYLGVKKGIKIATKVDAPTVEDKSAPILSTVKPETYMPSKK